MMISVPMQVDRTLVPLPEEVVDHYLTILGVVRREPSLEALRELLAAHLTRIPFRIFQALLPQAFGIGEPAANSALSGWNR